MRYLEKLLIWWYRFEKLIFSVKESGFGIILLVSLSSNYSLVQ